MCSPCSRILGVCPLSRAVCPWSLCSVMPRFAAARKRRKPGNSCPEIGLSNFLLDFGFLQPFIAKKFWFSNGAVFLQNCSGYSRVFQMEKHDSISVCFGRVVPVFPDSETSQLDGPGVGGIGGLHLDTYVTEHVTSRHISKRLRRHGNHRVPDGENHVRFDWTHSMDPCDETCCTSS